MNEEKRIKVSVRDVPMRIVSAIDVVAKAKGYTQQRELFELLEERYGKVADELEKVLPIDL